MSKDKTIWYEVHPVSAERKAELVAQGLAIIDAVFMPADCVQGDPTEAAKEIEPPAEEATPAKRGRKHITE